MHGTVYGFGHPLYVTDDPRAAILKAQSQSFADDAGDPNWYAITAAVESAVKEQKGLFTNVDLYSGSLYRYLGIPNDLFTPLFEASRVAGQAAPRARAAREQQDHPPGRRVHRPRAASVPGRLALLNLQEAAAQAHELAEAG